MRPCKRCGVRPRAIDEGDGRELQWCIDCIRAFRRKHLPLVEVP